MINFDYHEEKLQLIIEGDLDQIRNNPYAWQFLNEWPLEEINDSEVSLYIPLDELDDDLSEIKSVIEEKCELEIGLKENANNILQKIYDNRNEFEEKSKKAKEIYWGKIPRNDFKDFTDHLKTSFPNRTLDKKQLLAAYHLAFSKSACNFSVPGAGKTTAVLAAFSYLRSIKEVDKILVVGPLACFSPWETEFKECFGHNPNSVRFDKNLSSVHKNFLLKTKGDEDLILMHYQSLANNLENVIDFLKLNDKSMVVIDEAHWIKSTNDGVWANSALAIAPYASSRVILTGTPAPNGFEDLTNLFEFIWPKRKLMPFGQNFLEDLSDFKSDMSVTRRKKNVDRLTSALKPYFVRVSKNDLNLPPPQLHSPIQVEMGPIQRAIYDFIEEEYADRAKDLIKREDVVSELIKAKSIRLRQTSTNPHLLKYPLENESNENYISSPVIDEPEIFNLIRDYKILEVPEKFKIAKKLIEKITSEGEKVIVWFNFVQNIKDFSEFLDEFQMKNEVIYGEIPLKGISNEYLEDNKTREGIINEFHNPDSKFKILIANTATIGESISLHMACSNAIYVERDFNAASYLQSKDRIHRKGMPQNQIANYYFLESSYSIDQTITERLNFKVKNLEEIIEHEIPLFSIFENENYEDLKAILRNYVSRQ